MACAKRSHPTCSHSSQDSGQAALHELAGSVRWVSPAHGYMEQIWRASPDGELEIWSDMDPETRLWVTDSGHEIRDERKLDEECAKWFHVIDRTEDPGAEVTMVWISCENNNPPDSTVDAGIFPPGRPLDRHRRLVSRLPLPRRGAFCFC